MKGSTKPTGLLYFGGFTTAMLGMKEGGYYWLLLVVLALVILVDAYRVTLHEEEKGCG